MTEVVGAEVETRRLLLLPCRDDYSDDFARICSNREVTRFISDGRPLPRADVEEILANTRAMWDDHGFGPWAPIEKATGKWIGRIGLSLLPDWPGQDRWEVGYELAPKLWGRGLATEGAREAIRFAWEHTPLERVISVTVPGHVASRRVMEKCGLSFQGRITWRGDSVIWYAVDRPDHAVDAKSERRSRT